MYDFQCLVLFGKDSWVGAVGIYSENGITYFCTNNMFNPTLTFLKLAILDTL